MRWPTRPRDYRAISGPAEIGALLVLTALFGLLSTGVIRNWCWTFWLILVAFMAGILRVPSAGL